MLSIILEKKSMVQPLNPPLQREICSFVKFEKKFAPKEWLNHSNEINYPFQNKLKKVKNEAIEWVVEYCNNEYKNNEFIKIGIEKGLISDYDSSRSVYSDVTDPYYLLTEKELFMFLK